MKKHLLISGIFLLVISGFAQKKYLTDSWPLTDPQLCGPQITPDGKNIIPGPFIIGQKERSFTMIGNTWYDTQTYNSGNLMNRIYEFPDGFIGATWIYKVSVAATDRYTAYNYFDGNAWSTATVQLGTDSYDGFPSYAPWGPDGEVVAHYNYIAGDGPVKILRREHKGTGVWQESVLNPPDGNHSIVWHSMITSGANHEYLHILAFVYDDPYMGQNDALLYYRSPDGGITWDINGIIIDGLGVDYFPEISALKYSWAQPVGNTIAFSYGFSQFDGLIFKSTDNGTTWTKFIAYKAPFDPYDLPDLTPTFGGGDGTSAIALDSQGKAHVVFGRMMHIHDVITSPPGGWYFYPNTEGLIYWNEDMPQLDSTIISTYTLDFLAEGGNLIGWVFPPDTTLVIPADQPNYGAGLTTGPELGIDANDNLFVVYAALAPENFSGDFYYRHLYGNSSTDGGITWNGIRDLNNDVQFLFSECVYPAVSPLVDDKIHVVFQEDQTPGTGSGEENMIDYMDFDKDLFVGLPRFDQSAGFEVSKNYPNPAFHSTYFGLKLKRAADVTVIITNLTGQTIKKLDLGMMNSGNNQIMIDISGLAPGIYFYSVQADDQKVTSKMVVGE
jgi:hypothetical protein